MALSLGLIAGQWNAESVQQHSPGVVLGTAISGAQDYPGRESRRLQLYCIRYDHDSQQASATGRLAAG
jgi:hypothetical protein